MPFQRKNLASVPPVVMVGTTLASGIMRVAMREMAAISRIATRMMPDASVVPTMTTGGTDAKFFRWKGIPAYGFGLHSLRIPYTEYPIMFHGHNERVDTESLRLSAMMWEALCRDFLA